MQKISWREWIAVGVALTAAYVLFVDGTRLAPPAATAPALSGADASPREVSSTTAAVQ